MKLVLKYVGYIMSIASAIAFVGGIAYAIGVWVSDKNYKAAKTEKLETLVQAVINTQAEQSLKIDSLYNGQQRILDRVGRITISQTNLKAYMIDQAATKQDVIDVMNIFNEEVKKNFGTDMLMTR